MRIKELIIEGFKSYPGRTQISGWDSSFNAITGLNGSGKSNILDAICFVLGMTNMTSMRAQNQQDLIYKRGQAGVTKASVTIVFDNTDRATSPVGLENLPEITVMRQISLPNVTKYLLNGHKAQQQQIQTLFQSVQLNINNPNFLIMQGRITKVLNMRPQEILGMVEEAAGTRMFEERKDKAKKTMGKKEKKVQEITALLEEEITPKLNTLRKEKQSFLQFQKTCSELERVGRLLRAFEWTDAQERVAAKEEEVRGKEKQVASVQNKKGRYVQELEAAEQDIEEVTRKRDKELKKGGRFTKLQEEVTELEKTLVKMRTQMEIKNNSVGEEEANIKTLEEELKTAEDSLEAKKVELAQLENEHSAVQQEHERLQAELNTAEELLQTLLTGLSSSNKTQSGGGYMGQIAEARQRESQGMAEETQNRQKLTMARKSLTEVQAKWREVEREAGEGKKKLERMRQEVEKLHRQVETSGWNEDKERSAGSALRAARDEVRQLTERRDYIKSRLPFLDFSYSDPHPNFDRSKVKGLVASLITLDSEHHNKATALEVAAGGRLYNVVVENEKIGKDLLTNGRLRKRVTIIPLNKINARTLSKQKMQAAQTAAGDKVRTALSLVGYPDEVAKAMEYVFSDTLICDDSDSAKRVTFNREIGVKSVTLQGDVYDPSGTLSGGAAPSSNHVLVSVQELLDAERNLQAAVARLRSLEQEEARTKGVRDAWKTLSHNLELKQHEMQLLEEQVGGSNATKVATDIDTLKQTIEELEAAVQASVDKQKMAKVEIVKLEKDMAEFKNNKEGKIEQLKADVSKKKTVLQKHNTALKLKQKDKQTAVLECETMSEDIATARDSIQNAREGIEKLRAEVAKIQDKCNDAERAHKQAERKLHEERATLTRFDDELKELEGTVKQRKQKISDADLELKQLEHDIVQLNKDKVAAEHQAENLEKQYDWIQDESQHFGKAGGQYDFSQIDVRQLRDRARELETAQKGLKKKINPKAINMLESVEKQETSLKKMLSTVLKDKEKIEQTIEELDRYKRDALDKTWKKVNGDFGGIFGELLPGNFAKLQPPEGQDLTQGLEVKVQLGSVWKQSLTELSGGQRSLIALSLIMSLLQFKPAPMYILDEIDAALDLSHTQHIGQLFRNRFKGSQFIVVSLKEGLFTNANVLFRTRFRDGTSIVERITERSTSNIYEPAQNETARGSRRVAAAA